MTIFHPFLASEYQVLDQWKRLMKMQNNIKYRATDLEKWRPSVFCLPHASCIAWIWKLVSQPCWRSALHNSSIQKDLTWCRAIRPCTDGYSEALTIYWHKKANKKNPNPTKTKLLTTGTWEGKPLFFHIHWQFSTICSLPFSLLLP